MLAFRLVGLNMKLKLLIVICFLLFSSSAFVIADGLVSGTVSGVVKAGVTITLSGDATATTTTDGSGNYSFLGYGNGSYTVTPSLAGYAFTPASSSITFSGTKFTKNFVATKASGIFFWWCSKRKH